MSDRRTEIAEVIRQRIISALHCGVLAEGARLPSTREVAEEFDVAPRTAMSAYRVLQEEGLVELRERSGIYVAAGGAGGHPILTQLAGWLVDTLVEARAREVAPISFPERARRCLETLRLRAVCVAGNRDQLDHISHELLDDYGIESEGLEPEQLGAPDAEAQRALARADLLVSTSVHATVAKHAARRLGKPAIAVSLRRPLMEELVRNLARGPVYWIATDRRFRDALRAVFGPMGHGDNARVLILGEDDLATIPSDAPTYIMRRAHERLGNTELALRLHPTRRVFSDEMARDLLSFVVRANMAAMAGAGR